MHVLCDIPYMSRYYKLMRVLCDIPICAVPVNACIVLYPYMSRYYKLMRVLCDIPRCAGTS